MGYDDPDVYHLRIAILAAKDLPRVIFHSLTVELQVGSTKVLTMPVSDSGSIKWNEQFDFPLTEKDHIPFIRFRLYDQDKMRKRRYGEIDIPIESLFRYTPIGDASSYDDPDNGPTWYELSPSKVGQDVSGSIQLKIGFFQPPPTHAQQQGWVEDKPEHFERTDWIHIWRRLSARLGRPKKTFRVYMRHFGRQLKEASQDISAELSQLFKSCRCSSPPA